MFKLSYLFNGPPGAVFDPAAFRMKFKAFFACLMFLVAIAFISMALFTEIGQKAKEAGPIVGFLTGTLLTAIVAYYFTNTDETLSAQLPAPVIKPNEPDKIKPKFLDKVLLDGEEQIPSQQQEASAHEPKPGE